MAFDIEGARKAGYSEAEIADYLAKDDNFDTQGARKAGYSDEEIVKHLTEVPPQATPQPEQPAQPQAPSEPQTGFGESAVGGFAKGATFGLAPQISAGVRALPSLGSDVLSAVMPGRTMSTKYLNDYNQKLAEYQAQQKTQEAEHPVASIGGQAIAAAPSFARAAVGAAPGALGVAQRVLQTAGVGAAQGAGGAVGEGKDPEEVMNSALWGGGTAVAGYGLGAGLSKAFAKFGATELQKAFVNTTRKKLSEMRADRAAGDEGATTFIRNLERVLRDVENISPQQFQERAAQIVGKTGEEFSDLVKPGITGAASRIGKGFSESILPKSLNPKDLIMYALRKSPAMAATAINPALGAGVMGGQAVINAIRGGMAAPAAKSAFNASAGKAAVPLVAPAGATMGNQVQQLLDRLRQ